MQQTIIRTQQNIKTLRLLKEAIVVGAEFLSNLPYFKISQNFQDQSSQNDIFCKEFT